MKTLEIIADDLLYAVGDLEEVALELECEPAEEIIKPILIRRIHELGPDLDDWISKWLGRSIGRVFSRIDVERPGPGSQAHEMVSLWLNYRGIPTLQVSVLPQKLYNDLCDLMAQPNIDENQIVFLQKIHLPVERLLKFLLLYYFPALENNRAKKIVALSSLAANEYTSICLENYIGTTLGNMTWSQLWLSLLHLRKVKFPPYSSITNQPIEILSPQESELVKAIITSSSSYPNRHNNNDAITICNLIESLFDSWRERFENACLPLPIGAVITCVSTEMYTHTFSCKNENYQKLSVEGGGEIYELGHQVLLHPDIESIHWGDKLHPVPDWVHNQRSFLEENNGPPENIMNNNSTQRVGVSDDSIVSSTNFTRQILHLSDLHICADSDASTLAKAVAVDLKDSQDGLGLKTVDLVIVTGDITNRASAEEFAKAEEFIRCISKEMSVSLDHFVIIPGNHDVDWEQEVYTWKKKRHVDKNQLEDGTYVEEVHGFQLKNDDKYYDRFRSFSENFYEKLFSRPYPRDYNEQSIIHNFGDIGLEVLAFNSAWEIDEYFCERSSLHPGGVTRCVSEIQNNCSDKNRPFRLAAWHHPVTGEEKIKDVNFLEQLRKVDVKLCLHGHVHEERVDHLHCCIDKKSMYTLGAGSLVAPASHRPESTPNFYNLIEVDTHGGVVRVHTRSKNKTNSAWTGYAIWPGNGKHEKKSYFEIYF